MEQQNVGSKRSASGAGGKIAAKSHEAAEQLKDAVVGSADQVRERARSARADSSERIRGVATQLQNMSQTLREDDPLAADLAARASRGIETVAHYVGASDARTLLRDTEQLARRQPALFFGGAFLLGLAAGRFLKSSSPQPQFGGTAESEGGPLARRQDRESGFFPSTDRNVRSNRRYQENYDAAFARDTSEYASSGRAGESGSSERSSYGTGYGNAGYGSTSERGNGERSSIEREPSRRDAPQPAGVDPASSAGRGNRP